MNNLLLSDSLSVLVVRSREELLDYREELTQLAANALEKNIFHEPWMLFPALESFSVKRSMFLVLIFATVRRNGVSDQLLCGFFPLERRWFYHGLPIPYFTIWRYPYCFLSTPLVHKHYAESVYRVFFDWVKTGQKLSLLLIMSQISADGAANAVLESVVYQQDNIKLAESRFGRAMFYPAADAESYLAKGLSGKSRKELRRQKKRLAELGKLTLVELEHESELENWLDDFIQLEASGWKGRQMTAFKSNAVDRNFFLTITREAFKLKKLMILALQLDGRPVAMKCNLLNSDGGYAFKIAFDENFGRYSPGILLEMENIRILHRNSVIRWMDSCAAPDNLMINRLWLHRRPMRTIVVSTSPLIGNFIVNLLPALKQIKTWCLSRSAVLKHGWEMFR